jgi:hypothetical protein
MDLWYEKNIATDQYKVNLCDNIYINEIANMMVILKSTTYSNDLQRSMGKTYNRVSAKPRAIILIPKQSDSIHLNRWLDVEQGRNDLITNHLMNIINN